MELPNIGKNCEDSTCKKLDFLPFQCKCNKIFCSDHYTIHIQQCPILKEHYKVANLDAKTGMWTCSHPDCKEKSLVPLICEKCHEHFCVAHRHITECFKEDPEVRKAALAKLQAPIDQYNEAKARVDKELDKNIAGARRSATNKKKAETAMKVQLMRIKNKATGLKGIPSTDKVYFNVTKPKICGLTTQPVFVSKTWTLGRVIDAIADECKIPNKNNVAGADKLCLYFSDEQDDNNCAQDLTQTVINLLTQSVLIDGQNLRLEYVNK